MHGEVVGLFCLPPSSSHIVGWYKQDDSDNTEIVDLLIRNKPLLEELEFLNSNKTVLAFFVEISNEN